MRFLAPALALAALAVTAVSPAAVADASPVFQGTGPAWYSSGDGSFGCSVEATVAVAWDASSSGGVALVEWTTCRSDANVVGGCDRSHMPARFTCKGADPENGTFTLDVDLATDSFHFQETDWTETLLYYTVEGVFTL